MRVDTKHRTDIKLGAVILLSVILHGLFFFLVAPYIPHDDEFIDSQNRSVSDFSVILSPITPPEVDPLHEAANIHVVPQKSPDQQELPTQAQVVDRYDRVVEKETVSRADASPEVYSPPSRPSATKPNEAPKVERNAPVPEQESHMANDAISEETHAPDEMGDSDEPVPDIDNVSSPSPDALRTEDLFPSLSNLAGMRARQEPSPTSARLNKVEESDNTLLNSRRTRYWSFFDRLYRSVEQHWNPKRPYMQYDPTGEIYGFSPRTTLLHITLNGDGSLRRIHVLERSGVPFLDDEAVRAVRAAGPFPNPPPGLQDDDGLIHLNFSFHVDTKRSGRFNMRQMRR